MRSEAKLSSNPQLPKASLIEEASWSLTSYPPRLASSLRFPRLGGYSVAGSEERGSAAWRLHEAAGEPALAGIPKLLGPERAAGQGASLRMEALL